MKIKEKVLEEMIKEGYSDLGTTRVVNKAINLTLAEVRKEVEKWIEKKKEDDYWTRNDDNGNMNAGKEICLNELEETLKARGGEND